MEPISTQQELENFMYNLAWLRKKHGLSRTRMAAILGIRISTLDRLERGDLPEDLPAEVLLHLMRWYCLTPSALLSGHLDEQS